MVWSFPLFMAFPAVPFLFAYSYVIVLSDPFNLRCAGGNLVEFNFLSFYFMLNLDVLGYFLLLEGMGLFVSGDNHAKQEG